MTAREMQEDENDRMIQGEEGDLIPEGVLVLMPHEFYNPEADHLILTERPYVTFQPVACREEAFLIAEAAGRNLVEIPFEADVSALMRHHKITKFIRE